MLDKQKDIDGVVIATPDHLHAVVAKAAMQTGKHVYVQKPLTYSVHEARVLARARAGESEVVTQMGNQGHSSDGARLINEWIQAGVIGPVRRGPRLDQSSGRVLAAGRSASDRRSPAASAAAESVRQIRAASAT